MQVKVSLIFRLNQVTSVVRTQLHRLIPQAMSDYERRQNSPSRVLILLYSEGWIRT
jgi:hypothetical protein